MANEKRLIDANEMKNNIMEAMMRQFEKNGDQIALRIAEMMWHFIDETDTVDAVEVVHGRWILERIYRKCSLCEWIFCIRDEEGDLQKFNYCPNCGMLMDGGAQC